MSRGLARPVSVRRGGRRPGVRGGLARLVSVRRGCERGDYAVFIAVIVAALLLFGGIAYDGPRLLAARQDALHLANEAARVAAATVAAGGTLEDAEKAAQTRVDATGLVYGQEVMVVTPIDCVGSRVQVTVTSRYAYRSALGLARSVQPIAAVGAAEARLVLPGEPEQGSPLHHLGECPLK